MALGLVIARASLVLHLWLVPHAPCEHGELVEVDRHAHATEASKESDGDGDEVRVDKGSAAESEGHDHCDALAVRHLPGEAPAIVAEASELTLPATEGLSEGAEARPVPLLFLAPKASPPAA